MIDKNLFLETLHEVAEIAATSSEKIKPEEVHRYFEGMELSEEQEKMVYEYLNLPPEAKATRQPECDKAAEEEEPEVETIEVYSDTDSASGIQIGADRGSKDTIEEEEEEFSQVVVDKTDYTVLVVDDQSSVTEIMQTTLAEHFKQVLTAKDGVEALKVLRSNRPDAVITDVKMPRMDGYELCRQIKQDITISHIPVVLMTDNTNRKRVMISYKTGADAYLPKPFDVELMMQVVINLINCRRQILNKLKTPGQATLPQEITISYADENFLTKINQLIEQHIDDTQLDIALLESEMCMSRTSLFNKMKALTNMGCNEYITKQRMEKAIRLVKESALTFAEISEKVGYSTPSYFSAAFKQFTGMTPTQYKNSFERKNLG